MEKIFICPGILCICTEGIPLVVQLQNDGINGANGSAADRRSGSAIIHK